MSYQGNKPPTSFESPKKDRFTGITGTTCSLTYAVSSNADILVWVNGVKQDFTNYSVSGSTLTLGGTLVSSDIVEVTYVGRTYGSTVPTDASVGTSALQDDAVTAAKLSSTAVDNTNTNSTLITAQTEKSSLVDADKFLISDSAASGALKYVQKSNLPSGALNFISETSTTSSHSGVDLNNIFTSTYENYLIIGDITVSNSGDTIRARFRDSGGSMTSSEYTYRFQRYDSDSNTSTNTTRASTDSYFQLTEGVNNNATRISYTFKIHIFDPYSSSKRAGLRQESIANSTAAVQQSIEGAGQYKAGATIHGIGFYPSSNNFSNSTFRVYGYQNS